MDVTLSIVAGLGLRIFLITVTSSGPTGKLTAALLGVWEGVIVHQLSARSRSPDLDHVLAYGLRLAADLLISRDFLRLFMVLPWTAFGALISEAVSPHASLRSAFRRQREREKERERERRHRHSWASPEALPIISTPLPLRTRTSRPFHPEPHLLPSQPPQQLSPPLISSIPPLTPPSFFLHGTSDIDSPSPKPVHLQILQPVDSLTRESLPVRPRSGLASTFERSPDSGSLLGARNLLPTPPESAQSAVPSEGHDVQNSSADFHDTAKSMSPRRLSPIAEISSPEGSTSPERVDQGNKTDFSQNQHSAGFSPFEEIPYVRPPVFTTLAHSSSPQVGTNRILTSSYSANQDPDGMFTTTFSPAAPIPVPIPQRNRQHPLWQVHITPRNSHDINIEIPQVVDATRNYNDDLNNDHDNINDKSPESDELQTPGLRHTLNAETDSEHDDPLLTPVQMKSGGSLEAGRDQLSPLGLNVNSGLSSDDYINPSDVEGDSSDPPPDTMSSNEVLEEPHMPGSLLQNLLLQPPLPASGPFLRPSSPPESPAPPSPSTIFSDTSMLSQLSTRVPSRLFLRADELRKQAREDEQLREQLDKERKTAEAQGKTAEALILKIRVRELDDRAYKLHEKAARRYYAACNPLERCHKIDLHGLRPREAFVRTERALAKAIKEGRKQVFLIVGQGRHSINGKAVLKKTVQTEITRNGFQCEVHLRNPGILVVTLPPPQPPH